MVHYVLCVPVEREWDGRWKCDCEGGCDVLHRHDGEVKKGCQDCSENKVVSRCMSARCE